MARARIRLARIAFTKLQKAIFGTRRVALESKKIAYESLVLSLLLYGSECWVVNAESMRLLLRFHRKRIHGCNWRPQANEPTPSLSPRAVRLEPASAAE